MQSLKYGVLIALSAVVGCGAELAEDGDVEVGESVDELASAQQTQKLFASDGQALDEYGGKMSTDGTTLVIGSRFANFVGLDSGAAYIYTRTGGSWTFVQRILGNDTAPYDSFGASVAVDGNTMVVGGHKIDQVGAPNAGAFYVFQKTNGVWTQTQKVYAYDYASEDHFGWQVSLQNGTLIVGSPEDDDKGTDSGSVYLYTQTGSTFTFSQKLTGSDGAAGDAFGSGLARDGNTLVVGARSHDKPKLNSGAAYVFGATNGVFAQTAKLTASDGQQGDGFGFGVSVFGNRALISAITDDDSGTDAGSAYTFVRDVNGNWAQEQKLLASDGAAQNNLGRGLHLEGNVAVIGSVGDASFGTYAGSAYLFGLGPSGWTQDQKLYPSDIGPGARFGYWVEGNAGEFIIASDQGPGLVSTSGAVYTFSVAAPFDCSNLGDGTPCDDGNLCTQGDACQSGVCTVGAPVVCAAPTSCQVSNTCDTTTGQCVAVATADGSSCSDGNACTGPDTCQSGVCVSGPGGDPDADGLCNGSDNCPNTFNPSQVDLNADGAGDACVAACLIYQRGTSGTFIDSAVAAGQPNTNSGSVVSLHSGTNGTLRRSGLQADLAAIPLGSTVVSATLALNVASVNGTGTVNIHRILAPWTESTLTWNTLSFSPTIDASTPAAAGTMSFDVASLVQQWLTGTYPNQGFVLEQDAGGSVVYRSSEFATVAQRPKLTLCVLTPAQ